MHKIAIINGPNLNMLGSREQEIYGSQTFEAYLQQLKQQLAHVNINYYQTNVEGEIVNLLQKCNNNVDAIVLNAAGYTHTSVAIADAIAAIDTPVLEVHISNIYAREAFRQKSLTAPNCVGCIVGLGLKGYELAIQYFLNNTTP